MENATIPHRDHPFTHKHAFWDLMIAVLCGACAILAFHDFPTIIRSIGSLGLLTLIYGSFIEPQRIKLNKKNIQIDGCPPLKIALVADFHVGPYKGKAFVSRIVQQVNALKPDIILLPGDFLEDYDANLDDISPLRDLHAPLGMFASIGNHDSGDHILGKQRYRTVDRSDDVARYLTSMNINVMQNRSVMIERDGKQFAIAGIDDPWMDASDLSAAFKNINDETPVILLAHNPDVILDQRHERADLIVCGHTHGGQVRLPFLGPVPPIPNQLGRKYDQGIFRLKNGATLAITHGCGESLVRSRLFCVPEIMVLHVNKV